MIKIKRVFDEAESGDGYRILVDRLWPRGLAKEKAKVNLWIKEVAPSDELRKWFSHDPAKWEDFKKRYEAELKDKTVLLNQIRRIEGEKETVTLLYGTKEREHNNAVALHLILQKLAAEKK